MFAMLSQSVMRGVSTAALAPGKHVLARSVTPSVQEQRRGASVVLSATRAPSAFNLFTKDRYGKIQEDLKKQNKEAKLADVTAIIRGEWGQLNDSQKKPYQAESDKRKEEVALMKAEEKKNAGPSKPASSYAMFTKEKYPEVQAMLGPSAKLPDITKQISQLWKAMPEEEKKQRVEAARAQSDAYKAAKAKAEGSNNTN